MEFKMFSIVCIYNNEEILNNYLQKGLIQQNTNFDLILLDNTNHQFKSASEGYNFAGNKAKGEYIIFLHQDVLLKSNSCLQDLESMLKKLKRFGIAGVAGSIEQKESIFSNITHGYPPIDAGITFTNPIKAQTLDETFIIIPREIFNIHKFDEKTCNGWHLHVVEYCLSVKKLGYDVYILPISAIYHKSVGFHSEQYYVILANVLEKHKNNYKYIYATTGHYNTKFFPKILRIWRILKVSENKYLKKIVADFLNILYKILNSDKLLPLMSKLFNFSSINTLISSEIL